MKEIWKDVMGYEGFYQISNLGRVKSLQRGHFVNDKRGRFYPRIQKEIILRNLTNSVGYVQVNLHKNGKCKIHSNHRLVATHFLPNLENKKQVNHKNGIKSDSRLENLEWCTASENGLHGYRVLGHIAWQKGNTGKNTPTAKQVIQKTLEGEVVKVWDCASDAVREFGFDSGSITRVCQGKSKYHKGYKWEYGKQSKKNNKTRVSSASLF